MSNLLDYLTVRPDVYAAKWYDGSNGGDVVAWASDIPLFPGSSDDYGAHMTVDGSGDIQLDGTIQPDTAIVISTPSWVVVCVAKYVADTSGLVVPATSDGTRATGLTSEEFAAYRPLHR